MLGEETNEMATAPKCFLDDNGVRVFPVPGKGKSFEELKKQREEEASRSALDQHPEEEVLSEGSDGEEDAGEEIDSPVRPDSRLSVSLSSSSSDAPSHTSSKRHKKERSNRSPPRTGRSGEKKSSTKAPSATPATSKTEDRSRRRDRSPSVVSRASKADDRSMRRGRSPPAASQTSKAEDRSRRPKRSPSVVSRASKTDDRLPKQKKTPSASVTQVCKSDDRPRREDGSPSTVARTSKADYRSERSISRPPSVASRTPKTGDKSVRASRPPSRDKSSKKRRVETDTVPQLELDPPVLPTDYIVNKNFGVIMSQKGGLLMGPGSVSIAQSTKTATKGHQKRPATEELCKLLPPALRENELAIETVKMLSAMCRTQGALRKGHIAEAVQYIRYVPIDEHVEEPDVQFPDTTSYLFSAFVGGSEFGYDADDIANDPNAPTLVNAFDLTPDTRDNSLDLVFRAGLKRISMDTLCYDDQRPVSSANPMFISARQVELELLRLIINHYREALKEEILDYIALNPKRGMKVQELVEGSKCKHYIRALVHRYGLRTQNVNEVMQEENVGVAQMRVWTTQRLQAETNVRIHACLNKDGLTGVELIDAYARRMNPFVHTKFIADVLRSSELVAWLCFGITTNNLDDGAKHMPLSYLTIKRLKDNKKILWNYPLASRFKTEQKSIKRSLLQSDFMTLALRTMEEDCTSDTERPQTAESPSHR